MKVIASSFPGIVIVKYEYNSNGFKSIFYEVYSATRFTEKMRVNTRNRNKSFTKDFSRGKTSKIGDTHIWGDKKKHKKVANGKWVLVTNNDNNKKRDTDKREKKYIPLTKEEIENTFKESVEKIFSADGSIPVKVVKKKGTLKNKSKTEKEFEYYTIEFPDEYKIKECPESVKTFYDAVKSTKAKIILRHNVSGKSLDKDREAGMYYFDIDKFNKQFKDLEKTKEVAKTEIKECFGEENVDKIIEKLKYDFSDVFFHEVYEICLEDESEDKPKNKPKNKPKYINNKSPHSNAIDENNEWRKEQGLFEITKQDKTDKNITTQFGFRENAKNTRGEEDRKPVYPLFEFGNDWKDFKINFHSFWEYDYKGKTPEEKIKEIYDSKEKLEKYLGIEIDIHKWLDGIDKQYIEKKEKSKQKEKGEIKDEDWGEYWKEYWEKNKEDLLKEYNESIWKGKHEKYEHLLKK